MAKQLFSYESLVHALSGVCGSCTAMSIVLPLDTVRTRLILDKNRQAKSTLATMKDLVSEEGITTLFRGAGSTIQCVAASNFIYFYTFHGLKKWLSRDTPSALTDLLFACVAGSVNVIITNPLWVVNTRIKMQGTKGNDQDETSRFKGLINGLLRIGLSEGKEKLWAGTVASLVLVSNPAIKFTTYEYLKRIILPLNETQLSPLKAFLIGALASAVATVITYPVQVVQTKSRHGGENLPKNANFLQMFRYVVSTFGPRYLYKGLEVKLIQSIVTAGFMFLTYEKIAALIFALSGLQKAVKSKS